MAAERKQHFFNPVYPLEEPDILANGLVEGSDFDDCFGNEFGDGFCDFFEYKFCEHVGGDLHY